MKNFQHQADTVEFTAPVGGTVSGQVYIIGAMVVVAVNTVAAGVRTVGARGGCYRLAEHAGEAVTGGEKAFWGDATKTVRNATAAGRFMIGTIETARLAADTYADVILDKVAVTVI